MEKQDKQIKKLIGKIVVKGSIIVKTGLAIGGNKSGIDIGAMDNPVIKTNKGIPYIPGSSLKGKMRSLLARVAGTADVEGDVKLMENEKNEYRHIARVFGYGAREGKDIEERGEALLKVRDSFIEHFDTGHKYTEEKFENSIDRIKGTANPRPIERVNPDTKFKIEVCLDVYDKKEAEEHLELLDLAFQLLKQDSLGGGGSRGNGRVDLSNLIFKCLKVSDKILIEDDNFVKYNFKCNQKNESNTSKTEA